MFHNLALRWLVLLAAMVVIAGACGQQVGNLPDRVVGFLHNYEPANIDTYKGYFTPKIQNALGTHDTGGARGGLAVPGRRLCNGE